MADEYEETGTCLDVDGDEVKVGHTRAIVIVATSAGRTGKGFLHLGPDERDHFNRLYQAAETAAEAWDAAHPEGGEFL
jgi:6-phosphogluconate dehydrogenase (decarboxylating)